VDYFSNLPQLQHSSCLFQQSAKSNNSFKFLFNLGRELVAKTKEREREIFRWSGSTFRPETGFGTGCLVLWRSSARPVKLTVMGVFVFWLFEASWWQDKVEISEGSQKPGSNIFVFSGCSRSMPSSFASCNIDAMGLLYYHMSRCSVYSVKGGTLTDCLNNWQYSWNCWVWFWCHDVTLLD